VTCLDSASEGLSSKLYPYTPLRQLRCLPQSPCQPRILPWSCSLMTLRHINPIRFFTLTLLLPLVVFNMLALLFGIPFLITSDLLTQTLSSKPIERLIFSLVQAFLARTILSTSLWFDIIMLIFEFIVCYVMLYCLCNLNRGEWMLWHPILYKWHILQIFSYSILILILIFYWNKCWSLQPCRDPQGELLQLMSLDFQFQPSLMSCYLQTWRISVRIALS